MITNLEERKGNLLSQIERLKREIEISKWSEYKELALLRCTGDARDLGLNRLQEESSKN
jgi:hypothetical protein